jgi:predicted secreted Zn-dependent protease
MTNQAKSERVGLNRATQWRVGTVAAAQVLGVAVLLGISAATPVVAEPLVKRQVVYYDVSGRTPQEIRSDLNRVRPTDEITGKRHDGFTDWNVRWTYRYRNVGQDCAIARVAVTVTVTIKLPRLKPDAGTPPGVTRSFTDYVQKLSAHEEGHAEIAIETARRIEKAILDTQPQPTCDAIGRTANAHGQSLIKEANRKNIDYDERTDHGRSQGARFP